MIREKSHSTILPLIPEIRNVLRFMFSGINGKKSGKGFFSDHRSDSCVLESMVSGINGKIVQWDFSLITHRFLFSGINGKNSTMGFFSDHKSNPSGSIPVSPSSHGINQNKNHPTQREIPLFLNNVPLKCFYYEQQIKRGIKGIHICGYYFSLCWCR